MRFISLDILEKVQQCLKYHRSLIKIISQVIDQINGNNLTSDQSYNNVSNIRSMGHDQLKFNTMSYQCHNKMWAS